MKQETEQQPDTNSTLIGSIEVIATFGLLIILCMLFLVCQIKTKRKKLAAVEQLQKENTTQQHDSADLSGITPQQKKRVKDVYNYSKKEITRDRFEVSDQIGSGNFGKVFKGELLGLYGNDSKTTVAMKSINGQKVNENELENLLCEIEIMMDVPPHLNLVSLIASCASEFEMKGELWLLLEFCQHGDLKNYLIKNQTRILSGTQLDIINSRCLIKWAYDVANGMQFLSKNKIMHGDLAARNILMDENLLVNECPVAKVADFGLSKKLNDYAIYEKESREFVPWKWMAMEYLMDQYFTLASDVWSYGVLFWEILSFGKIPYGHQDYDEVVAKLERGSRLTFPDYTKSVKIWSPENLFEELANVCFKADPEARGNFTEVIQILEKALLADELTRYSQMTMEYETKRAANYGKIKKRREANLET